MNEVNKTLYIPLYGKAAVSEKGVILRDEKAEEIWKKANFPLKRKSRSKWLAYYTSMRAAVFDKFVLRLLEKEDGETVVLHLGCGLDSRVERVNAERFPRCLWYDVDFPEVVEERKKYFRETDSYRMLGYDLTRDGFLAEIPAKKKAIVLLEGIAMYLTNDDLSAVFRALDERFEEISLLVDVYTEFGAKISKYKNPINDVGVRTAYGLDDPTLPISESGLRFVAEREITPSELVNELQGLEKRVFEKLFAGSFSKKLYKLYEYEKNSPTEVTQ